MITAGDLADHLGNAIGGEYRNNATRIKAAYNALLWDSESGLYRDNDDPTSIHPQDGNSLAVLFNLTTASVILLLSIAFSSTSVASLVGTLIMLFKYAPISIILFRILTFGILAFSLPVYL